MKESAKLVIIGLHYSHNYKLPHRLLIPLCLLLIFGTAASAGRDYKVGGRREVKDVQSNQEVQDLGRYCVRQYNKDHRRPATAPLLSFSEVVEAETQVVSGIKYFLKISAASESGGGNSRRDNYYDAVVLIKPWGAESKALLDFGPSRTNM
ncbi:unnamed protein product [Cuscuta campestris]|uniref:Cystatin domain-containing protein n=1 Tax=Cuscuta campestris TaxID=132261 RepID=A0A484MTK9_9ASTE|nr:unnamed protein product [Cuscuta campestris]